MSTFRTAKPQTEAPSGKVDPIGETDLAGVTRNAAGRHADGYVREVRRILARFGTPKAFSAGASLFDPADTSRRLYIVESGTIDISLPDDPAHHPLASFHAGAIFQFDLGSYQIASIEAAEDSVVIDLPFSRLDRLCRQEMELRLLLRQCHAFDLKSFLDVCYPARSRFRLAHKMEAMEEPSEATRNPSTASGHCNSDRRFMIPLTPGASSHFTGKGRRKARSVRRSREAAGVEREQEGET